MTDPVFADVVANLQIGDGRAPLECDEGLPWCSGSLGLAVLAAHATSAAQSLRAPSARRAYTLPS